MFKVYKYYDCKKKGILATVVRVVLVDVAFTVIWNSFVIPSVRKYQQTHQS